MKELIWEEVEERLKREELNDTWNFYPSTLALDWMGGKVIAGGSVRALHLYRGRPLKGQPS